MDQGKLSRRVSGQEKENTMKADVENVEGEPVKGEEEKTSTLTTTGYTAAAFHLGTNIGVEVKIS